MIDLRSDTVTRPSEGMIHAMQSAQVGDDVFNEDPTVNQLEATTAELFGMEAGLFCPSGTMTNQIAIKAHCNPLDEVILDKLCHIYNYETGGYASNSGVSVKLLDGDRGRISAAQVEAAIQPDFDWLPISRLVTVEDTCNKGGGCFYELKCFEELAELCREHELSFHLDGARVFNALSARGNVPKDLHGMFDSISICLSKGLGAPVGSVLVGSKPFIKKARKLRKVMGGGMRQAGYLAAAGMYALNHHVDRLHEDHVRAKALAAALDRLDFVKCVYPADTNIVIFDLDGIRAEHFQNLMLEKGIAVIPFGPQTIRMVTHLDFDDQMLNQTTESLRAIKI